METNDVVFATPEVQLDIFCMRNQKYAWGFDESLIERLRNTLPKAPLLHLKAVVLEVELGDPYKTVCAATQAITSIFGTFYVRSAQDFQHFKVDDPSDSDTYFQKFGGETEEKGAKWSMIDVGTNRGKSILDVFGKVPDPQKKAPGGAVLWLASYPNNWIQKMDGVNIPYVWIPGYEIDYYYHRPRGKWFQAPEIGIRDPKKYGREMTGIGLRAYDKNYRNAMYTVPEYL